MPPSNLLRLGTRASALARWQADWVAARLTELGIEVELVPITTGGDVKQGPIGTLGGTGVFTKEIQRALLEESADVAVHSLKDLPTEPVDGLMLAAVPPRENPGDALVCNAAGSIDALPEAARVGTGSLRRRAQLLHRRADLQVVDIRGNLDTRLRKLDEGQYDAIILAQAGLRRMGWQDRITQALSPAEMLPAAGQGALGIECRTGDESALAIVGRLDDPLSHSAVDAERAMLATLRGGCLAPVGAWGRVEDDTLLLDGVVLSADGKQRIAASTSGPVDEAEAIGGQVAEQLLGQGAAELIADSRA